MTSSRSWTKDHGRLEIRRYWITEDLRTPPNTEQWMGLRSIGIVERRYSTADTQTIERRFFINFIDSDAQRFAHALRGRWGVEKRLLWRLDVLFSEDDSRICKGNAPAIMTSIRHLCVNLIRARNLLLATPTEAAQGRVERRLPR